MKQTVKWYSIRRRLNIRRRSSLLGMLWRLRRSRVSCNPSSKFLLGNTPFLLFYMFQERCNNLYFTSFPRLFVSCVWSLWSIVLSMQLFLYLDRFSMLVGRNLFVSMGIFPLYLSFRLVFHLEVKMSSWLDLWFLILFVSFTFSHIW